MEYIMEINSQGTVVLHTEDFNEIYVSDTLQIDNIVAKGQAKTDVKNGNLILIINKNVRSVV